VGQEANAEESVQVALDHILQRLLDGNRCPLELLNRLILHTE
jgi:hypothetical protein